jgi:glycosyltransferase involved in cell wall biosynthesis
MGRLGWEVARSSSIPIFLTVHQLPWFATIYLPNISGVRSAIESTLWTYARLSLRQYTSVIVPSQTISDLVATKTGISPMTISNGIYLKTFQSFIRSEDHAALKRRLRLPLDVPVILHVGRLDIDKNVERVVQAAARAMRQTEAHLLLVGDGSRKRALMRMCEELNIADRVHFPGYISLQEGLPEIFSLADVFVTASEIEVQSVVLLEAIASGLPIVAVRASFVPEVVHDGVNGILAEPGDINGLASAILTVLKNPAERQEMGKISRQLAESYDIQISIDLHEQLYASLLDELQPVIEKTNTQQKRVLRRSRTEFSQQ